MALPAVAVPVILHGGRALYTAFSVGRGVQAANAARTGVVAVRAGQTARAAKTAQTATKTAQTSRKATAAKEVGKAGGVAEGGRQLGKAKNKAPAKKAPAKNKNKNKKDKDKKNRGGTRARMGVPGSPGATMSGGGAANPGYGNAWERRRQ